jgi:hypothetical protein
MSRGQAFELTGFLFRPLQSLTLQDATMSGVDGGGSRIKRSQCLNALKAARKRKKAARVRRGLMCFAI